MTENPLIRSVLSLLVRRGVSILGATGATVSDDWITQTVSLLIMAGNEGYQWYAKYKADRAKVAVNPDAQTKIS